MDAYNNGDKNSALGSIAIETVPVAYVRPIKTDKGMNYAVCSAEGLQLAVFETEEAAYFAAKQHDLEPVLLH